MDKLDGSFSGLWTCELCSKTGTDCTCEHFDRGFARGRDKTLSDAEFAAEVWHAKDLFHTAWDDVEFRGGSGKDSERFVVERARMRVLLNMADNVDYKEEEK